MTFLPVSAPSAASAALREGFGTSCLGWVSLMSGLPMSRDSYVGCMTVARAMLLRFAKPRENDDDL